MKHTAPRTAVAQSSAEKTWRLLVELVVATRGDWRRKVTEATRLPFSRVRALWRLEKGPRTLADLAHELGTDAPATTVLVNALEQRGLVKRAPHPTDRRAKQVSLTAAGRRVLDIVDRIPDPPPAAFERLPQEQLERLRRILDQPL
jgi:DNA-binding MarR family transcriptional regulator